MDSLKWDITVDANDRRTKINWRELASCKDLIFLLVHRTFVSQYKQTILGPAWAIIQPFFTTVVYSFFFGNIAGLGATGVPNFIFYFSGTVIWTLFSNCLTHTSNAFISNAGILGKVYFPRIVMPISNALSQFISFAVQYMFLVGFLLYYIFMDVGLKLNVFIFFTPVLIIQCAILGMGFGMIISALTTKYRDLSMVVGFGVSLWSYCSPVAYDMFGRVSLLPGTQIYNVYMINPMTSIINFFRYAYLGTGMIDWKFYALSWCTTILVLMLGIRLFNTVEKTFMDTI